MISNEEMIIMKHLLIDDEDMRELPYFDCCGRFFRKCDCEKQGKLSIGVGRNIEAIGISENEATGLLINDIGRVYEEVNRAFTWFPLLNTPRRIVLMSMGFNLGIRGLLGFKKMISCIESSDFKGASKEMLDSKWSKQVGERALRLSKIMESGSF